MHYAREETKVTKARVETVTRTIAARTAEVRAEKERLLISEQGLSQAKGQKRERLADVRQSKAGVPPRGRRHSRRRTRR